MPAYTHASKNSPWGSAVPHYMIFRKSSYLLHFMCVCLSICVCVCLCVYIRVCMYVCVYTYIHYVCIYIHTCINMYVHTYVHISAAYRGQKGAALTVELEL